MAIVVIMPKLGLTMTEGVISKWHKAEGDTVEKGETLLEVSTDKITNEVEAGESGVLRKILVQEGDTALVSQPVAVIGAMDEDISGLLDAGQVKYTEKPDMVMEGKPGSDEKKGPVARKGFVKASPAAKKYARENGIDLALVTGTGPGGRVVEKDVTAFAREGVAGVKVSPAAGKMAHDMGVDLKTIQKDGRIMKEDVLGAERPSAIPEVDRRVAMTPMRRIIAERMSQSWHTAPMVTLNIEVDATRLKDLRGKLAKEYEGQGLKVSYNDIFMKICAKALMEHPTVNATIDGDQIIQWADANIGLAVALEAALIVPNVKAVQSKSLLDVSAETGVLVEKARNNKLTGREITGGTFTVTNLGMFGIDTFTPIINQPESAILGINAMADRPVVIDGQIAIRPVMNLSLTFDHRVVDGADAAKFLARIKELTENPILLFL